MSKTVVLGGLAAGFLLMAAPANASTFVLNGTFTTTTAKSATYASTASGGELGYNINATGWTTTGFNMLFTSASAASSGVVNQYASTPGVPNFSLYGPNSSTPKANGLSGAVPGGGSIVALDGAFGVGDLYQSISGLTVGHQYAVTFDWAGAQQCCYTGTNTEQLQVYLGNGVPTIAADASPSYDYHFTNAAETQSTSVLGNTQGGFTGWQAVTMDFTATNATEVLAFLAVGTPTGEPPMSLLTDVSMSDVTPPPSPAPEPGSLSLLLTGLMGGLAALKSKKWLRSY